MTFLYKYFACIKINCHKKKNVLNYRLFISYYLEKLIICVKEVGKYGWYAFLFVNTKRIVENEDSLSSNF